MPDLYQGEPRLCFDRAARRRACRIAWPVALLAVLGGCHAASPRASAPDRATPAPETHVLADPSYDWHGLLIAPLGSALKDIPLPLHEVLLFRDEAHSSAAVDEAECYAATAPAPRFLGRTPDEYLLCFKQDRLSRIQASVRVTSAQAPGVFAAACAGWLKNAPPATPISGPSGAAVQGSATPIGAACEGREGVIRFSGRLEEEPAPAEIAQSDTVISITLDSATGPSADRL
jgi:hypothetical protein